MEADQKERTRLQKIGSTYCDQKKRNAHLLRQTDGERFLFYQSTSNFLREIAIHVYKFVG